MYSATLTPNNSVEREPTSCACGFPSRLRRYGGPSRQTLAIMGTPKMIKVLNVSTQSSVLSVETSFFPDRAPEIHYVTLAGSEALQFQAVLTTYPFSINQEHAYFIETLSESGGVCFCNVRITSSGSRQRIQIEISAATHASLQQVFNSNIISEGYVHG